MTSTLQSLIVKLQATAKKNRDQFRYRINITQTRSGLNYIFVCEETADGHTLLSGDGDSIEAAVDDAYAGLESALEEWGYDPA